MQSWLLACEAKGTAHRRAGPDARSVVTVTAPPAAWLHPVGTAAQVTWEDQSQRAPREESGPTPHGDTQHSECQAKTNQQENEAERVVAGYHTNAARTPLLSPRD